MQTIVRLLSRASVGALKRRAIEETKRPQGDVSGGGLVENVIMRRKSSRETRRMMW
jgi:hypothetical protein